jgi:hypothetical protein
MRRLWPLVPVYVAALLWVDRGVTLHGQYALGALTWLVLLAAAWTLSPARRAQVAVVVAAATVGEVIGSLVWGVYHYRLNNLPMFVPPAHGLVYLTGIALAASLRQHTRALVVAAAVAAVAWGVAGLTVLPRLDVAGALGVPLLCVFLWLSRYRATYAGVFFAVAALELYGTAIGTWQWERALPGSGIPDGNPPSGVASGYVWFDVTALLLAPVLLRLVRSGIPSRIRHPFERPLSLDPGAEGLVQVPVELRDLAAHPAVRPGVEASLV